MDFVTGTVQEASVDEHNTVFGRTDTFFQVHGGTTLFVHDAHLHGEAWQPQGVFDTTEQFVSESHFFRTVHLRLNNVHRRCSRVLERRVPFQIVHGDQSGHHTVHDAFRYFAAVSQQNCRVGHQVTHVTDEQH